MDLSPRRRYILLCGFPPVFGSSAAAVTQEEEESDAEGFEEVLFPDAYWSDVSFGAKSLLRQMLHSDPTIRISAKEAQQDLWIQTWVSSFSPKLKISAPRASVDLDLVRNELYKSLGGLQHQSVLESPSRRMSGPVPLQRASTPPLTRKRARGCGNSTPRSRRSVERRASTTALMALADLYRGVAAPSVIAAVAVVAAAATAVEDDSGVVTAPLSPTGSKDSTSESAFAAAASPVAALSF